MKTMCEHDYFEEEGHNMCRNCGLVGAMVLDTRNVTYDQYTQMSPNNKHYRRKDRFSRLFHNLRGLQEIPIPLMQKIPANLALGELKKHMKKSKDLRKFLNKLPSIWYQLGHKLLPISELERKRAVRLFCEIKEKKSFLVVLPYICKQIGRSDLLKYLKTPSDAMMKKYDLFL